MSITESTTLQHFFVHLKASMESKSVCRRHTWGTAKLRDLESDDQCLLQGSNFAMPFMCKVDLEGGDTMEIRAYDREGDVTFTLFV